MKVFISLPMNGKTKDEIKSTIRNISNILKDRYDEEIEIIDAFFENAPPEAKPLWYLGESLILMSDADLVVFAPNWEDYRGCRIENACANEYGFKILYVDKNEL